jgi:RES domain-containing protein
MDNPLEHWREVISRQKPHKFSGAFWYRSVYRTRRKSILNMDGALLYGGRYNPQTSLERFTYLTALKHVQPK